MVLKTREKIFIGVAVVVGVVMGFDQFVTIPKKKEAAALQKQLQEYNEKLVSVTTIMAGLNSTKKRVEEKRKEKESMTGKISDDRQVGLLLDQLGKESQMRKIDLVQLNIKDEPEMGPPGEKRKSKVGALKKIVLDTGLLASFETIGPCLEGIQALPIFLEVEKVDVRRKEGSFPKLEVIVQQVIYISQPRPKEHLGKAHDRDVPPSS